jgi:hypothetical protein
MTTMIAPRLGVITSGAGTKEWLAVTKDTIILTSFGTTAMPIAQPSDGQELGFGRHLRETAEAFKRLLG